MREPGKVQEGEAMPVLVGHELLYLHLVLEIRLIQRASEVHDEPGHIPDHPVLLVTANNVLDPLSRQVLPNLLISRFNLAMKVGEGGGQAVVVEVPRIQCQ
jgi:hypothetical protein